MNSVFQFVMSHGWSLLLGTTVIMSAGYLLSLAMNSPISRQRLNEMTLVCGLIWLATPWLPDFERPRLAFMETLAIQNVRDKGATNNPPAINDLEVEATRTPDRTANQVLVSPKHSGNIERGRSAHADHMKTKLAGSGARPEKSNAAVLERLRKENWKGSQTVNHLWNTLTSIIPVCYVIGSLGVLCWLAFGQILLLRCVHGSQLATKKLDEVARSATIRRIPKILVSDRCGRVICFGILRPTVVIPRDVIKCCSQSQLRNILLHELGHIHQRDAVGQAIMNLALVFFYFHPVYWLIRRRICFNRELVADDWACAQSTKTQYASDLIHLAKQQTARRSTPLLVIGADNAGHSPFFRRIKMLIQRENRLATQRSRLSTFFQTISMASIVFALVLSVDISPAVAQQTQVKALNRKIAQLKAERQTLVEQVNHFKQKMNNVQAKLDAALEKKASITGPNVPLSHLSEQELERLDERAERILRLSIEHKDMDGYRKHQEARRQAKEWLERRGKAHPDRPQSSSGKPDQNSTKSRKGSSRASDKDRLSAFIRQYSTALSKQRVARIELARLKEQLEAGRIPNRAFKLGKAKLNETTTNLDRLTKVGATLSHNLQVDIQRVESELEKVKLLAKQGAAENEEITKIKTQVNQTRSQLEVLQEALSK